MKKMIRYVLSLQLLMLFTVGVLFASSTDQELAALLADLEGSTGSVATGEAPVVEQHNAAEDILGAMDSDKWAYAGAEKIEVKDVTTTGAKIMTTEVKYDGVAVKQYKIYYSDKTLATVQDFSKITQVVVDVKDSANGMVTLEFMKLDPNKTYYIVVAPVHPTDPTQEPLSFISDEVMFTTQQELVAAAVDTTTTKVFENVSYTYKDSLVTLTWTPSSAAKKSEVHLRHSSESAYTKVGSPMVNDGKFSFTVSKAGTYFLKMVAMDDAGNPVGQEHIQTVKIDEVQQPAQAVQAAPKVGPTTNIMIGLMLFSVLFYGATRFARATRN